MNGFPKYVLIFFVPFLMAIGCLMISDSIMDGFEDCNHIYRLSHTIPPLRFPDNCADSKSLLNRDILSYSALGLFIIPFVVIMIISWREKQTEDEGLSAIKISEQ